ncbi:hypothetical protein GIB67_020092 [Kingdonia uniflora]|uniref:No apical meristem-associated C-terminal domain-containing protein n=1 Tax=Kingdonia uniflora TaxID=39325 RepID=A0A7J7L2A4_9MAGN|nr:hypothetical protein GIB67_020092 [Kingdonia uniflora]
MVSLSSLLCLLTLCSSVPKRGRDAHDRDFRGYAFKNGCSCLEKVPALPRGYLSSANAHGATTTGLILNRCTSCVYSENDAHKIYQGLNGDNNFKHREVYKILARELRWANLRDFGLNHVGNILRNVVRRTSDNSSLGNSVGSNHLSEDPDGPPTPQSVGPNAELDSLLYEGGSRPISQKLFRKNFISQKALDGVAASSSGIQTMLDELQLEKRQTKEEKETRRAEVMQYWQAKMDFEQAKEDRKIMEKDLSTISGH